jgi:superfamily II DNA or RNA helicase
MKFRAPLLLQLKERPDDRRTRSYCGGSSVIELREYQIGVIDQIKRAIAAGKRRILIVAPTGSGKTVIAAARIKDEAPYRNNLFIAHRNELLTQAKDKLAHFEITAGIIKSGRDREVRPLAFVQVAGIQTLHTRAIRAETMALPEANTVWIDEAHHIRARTYQEIVEQYPDAIIIGLTATPVRGDGRGLGNVFEAMIECPQVHELIKLGFLVKPRIFAPPSPDLRGVTVASTGDYVISQLSDRMNTDALVGDIVEHWLKHAQRRRTIGFAVDIAHSVHITDELIKSGIRAEHIDGDTLPADREAIIKRLASGETEFVSNCGIFTEGFDCCDVGAIVLARPTRSFGLYLQMIGRGLRPAEDKLDCVILDHSGGVHRHGRPDDHIEWTLEADGKVLNKAHDARKAAVAKNADPFCECPGCGLIRMRGMGCDACGWQPKPRGRDVEVIDGDLLELGNPRTEIDRKIFYAELRGFQCTARRRDGSQYNSKWPACQYRDKFGSWPPFAWNDQAPIPPTPATLRWIKHRQIAWAKRNVNMRGAA